MPMLLFEIDVDASTQPPPPEPYHTLGRFLRPHTNVLAACHRAVLGHNAIAPLNTQRRHTDRQVPLQINTVVTRRVARLRPMHARKLTQTDACGIADSSSSKQANASRPMQGIVLEAGAMCYCPALCPLHAIWHACTGSCVACQVAHVQRND